MSKATNDFNTNPQNTAVSEAEIASLPVATNPYLMSVEEAVHRYRHCSGCGSWLHFTQVPQFAHGVVVETTQCLECNSKSHSTTHILQ